MKESINYMELKIDQYSIAIMLPPKEEEKVKEMKSQLRNIIGNYASSNSSGHITFNSFEGYFTKNEIERIKRNLERFCDNKAAILVRFVSLSSYYNSTKNTRTLYLEPDNSSKILLKDLMKAFGRDIEVKRAIKIIDPHLTIARNISQENFEIAMKWFENKGINLEFLCNRLSLRKLENSNSQFNVIDDFLFNNNPNAEIIQKDLF